MSSLVVENWKFAGLNYLIATQRWNKNTETSQICWKPYFGVWFWKAQEPGWSLFRVSRQEEKGLSQRQNHVGVTKM